MNPNVIHEIRMRKRADLWRRINLYLSLLRFGRAGEDIVLNELREHYER